MWGKAIKTSRERIKQQLNDLWQYAQSVAASELDDTDPSGFDKIDSEKVKPSAITADAGYGSEENYQWLEDKKITAYIKHNQLDRKQHKKKQQQKSYAADKLIYDEPKAQYSCP